MGEVVAPLLKGLFKATILVLVMAILAFMGRAVYGYMMDSPLLALREVVIEGCRKTSERDILSMTHLDREPNILSIKLATLRSKVETNPWIERAEISRIFPDRIWTGSITSILRGLYLLGYPKIIKSIIPF